MLGVTSALGRTFVEGDGRSTTSPAVVVSWPMFQRRFGRDPSAIGRRLVLDGALDNHRHVKALADGIAAGPRPRRQPLVNAARRVTARSRS